MKKSIFLNILIDVYMIASVLVLFFFSKEEAYDFLLALGAKSWFICLALSGSDVLNLYLSLFAFIWVLLFPVLVVVFYIMSNKKRYVPMCVLITADSMISLIWFFSCLVKHNELALGAATLDAIVSTVYTAILLICLFLVRGDGSLVPIRGDGSLVL